MPRRAENSPEDAVPDPPECPVMVHPLSSRHFPSRLQHHVAATFTAHPLMETAGPATENLQPASRSEASASASPPSVK